MIAVQAAPLAIIGAIFPQLRVLPEYLEMRAPGPRVHQAAPRGHVAEHEGLAEILNGIETKIDLRICGVELALIENGFDLRRGKCDVLPERGYGTVVALFFKFRLNCFRISATI